ALGARDGVGDRSASAGRGRARARDARPGRDGRAQDARRGDARRVAPSAQPVDREVRSRMTRIQIRSLPLRARIMAIVIGGAILPLALIGGWLTRSAARSGRALLESELDSSLKEVSQRMVDRWQYREADLGLLANNEPGHRVLADTAPDPDAVRYLQELTRT